MLYRHIYTVFLYLIFPFILLRLVWRGIKLPAYFKRWNERLGYFNTTRPIQHGIWVHAVSLGEVIAAVPLVNTLLKTYPDLPITVTTMTPTGSERTRALLGDKVFHVYVPYDLPGALQRFLRKVQPKLCIIMETELWPNLLSECARQHIPVLLANARLSERSCKGYQRILPLIKEAVPKISIIAAQSEADAQRFMQLGAQSQQLVIAGNIKFDLEVPTDIKEQGWQLRESWGSNRPVWIAASTHEGEESIVLQAHAQILQRLPECLLILVPRHPERFRKVETLCRETGWQVALRSQPESVNMQTQILLGDTLGELKLLYAAADIAFVGGSLVPIGGHNVLEALAVKVPVMSGNYTFNFTAIVNMLCAEELIQFVQEADKLAEKVIQQLDNTEQRQLLAEKGYELVIKNQGALKRHMELVSSLLSTLPIEAQSN